MNQTFDLHHYFSSNNLFEESVLKDWCDRHFVKYITSTRFPEVVMLHYSDACVYDKKWSEFSLACRGTIIDLKNKTLLAIPFFKWFNLDEMPETKYENLKLLGEFQTSEKLDGSMCILFKDPNTGKLRFTTKGSFDSEHGEYANSLVMSKEFWEMAEKYTETGTLMFELITKKFQIVIDYNKKGYKEGLYLIGYRHNISDKLATYMALEGIAEELGVPTFKTYAFDSLDQLIDTAKDLPVLEEGYVLRFPDDLLVKVKGNAYLAAHRFISRLSDKNILEAVSDGTADSLVVLAPEEYYEDVVAKIQHFKKRGREVTNLCYTYFDQAPKDTRKDFALWVNKGVESHLKGFMFQLFDNRPLDMKQIYKVVAQVDEVKGNTKL